MTAATLTLDTLNRVSREEFEQALGAVFEHSPWIAGRAGALSDASSAEQSSAGLDRLSDEEYERFGRLNAAYREKFGFPFIIAVRRHDKTGILDTFQTRLRNTPDQEVETALAEVAAITRLRLARLVKER